MTHTKESKAMTQQQQIEAVKALGFVLRSGDTTFSMVVFTSNEVSPAPFTAKQQAQLLAINPTFIFKRGGFWAEAWWA